MALTSRKRLLSRQKTLALLDELAKHSGHEALKVCIPHDLAAAELYEHTKRVPAHPDICEEIAGIAGRSVTGSAVFWSPEGRYLVLPPFPIKEKSSDSVSVDYLRSLLSRDYLIAVVLVRLGSYAVGVCRGEKLISSKVGTGLVHGRHRKGGSSSHRFERHRDKQIESFLTRVCQHAREHIESRVKSLDYITYGGARTTIELLQKRCPLLGNLPTPELPPLLDIPEPRQPVLVNAVNRIWSSTVIEWREED